MLWSILTLEVPCLEDPKPSEICTASSRSSGGALEESSSSRLNEVMAVERKSTKVLLEATMQPNSKVMFIFMWMCVYVIEIWWTLKYVYAEITKSVKHAQSGHLHTGFVAPINRQMLPQILRWHWFSKTTRNWESLCRVSVMLMSAPSSPNPHSRPTIEWHGAAYGVDLNEISAKLVLMVVSQCLKWLKPMPDHGAQVELPPKHTVVQPNFQRKCAWQGVTHLLPAIRLPSSAGKCSSG